MSRRISGSMLSSQRNGRVLTLFGIAGTLKSMGVSDERCRRILRFNGNATVQLMALGMLLGWLESFEQAWTAMSHSLPWGSAFPSSLAFG